jgi:hypothetical protein
MQIATVATFLALTSLAVGALWVPETKQETKQERFTHPMPKDMKEGMQRWVATMKPGPAHERLKELLGDYDIVIRNPMAGSQEIKSTGTISWLAEGKWLKLEWSGMTMFGKPGSGLWVLGYDNFKERYVGMMVDSLQTCMNTMSGHFDMSGDNLILWGTIDEPATPEQDKYVRYIFRGYGKDAFTFEIHDMMIGESNTKVIEMAFTRKK